jgi:predicted DNA-binding protein YlxM (UPF0122 family)
MSDNNDDAKIVEVVALFEEGYSLIELAELTKINIDRISDFISKNKQITISEICNLDLTLELHQATKRILNLTKQITDSADPEISNLIIRTMELLFESNKK